MLWIRLVEDFGKINKNNELTSCSDLTAKSLMVLATLLATVLLRTGSTFATLNSLQKNNEKSGNTHRE